MSIRSDMQIEREVKHTVNYFNRLVYDACALVARVKLLSCNTRQVRNKPGAPPVNISIDIILSRYE